MQELSSLVDDLAKRSHEEWALVKIRQGWSHATIRNDDLKHHPLLLPYEQLTEEVLVELLPAIFYSFVSILYSLKVFSSSFHTLPHSFSCSSSLFKNHLFVLFPSHDVVTCNGIGTYRRRRTIDGIVENRSRWSRLSGGSLWKRRTSNGHRRCHTWSLCRLPARSMTTRSSSRLISPQHLRPLSHHHRRRQRGALVLWISPPFISTTTFWLINHLLSDVMLLLSFIMLSSTI